jgi:hypothetical protein
VVCRLTNKQSTGWWYVDLQIEFLQRFDPKNEAQGPQRLKNLYFAYLVELRALIKAAPYLLEVCWFYLVVCRFTNKQSTGWWYVDLQINSQLKQSNYCHYVDCLVYVPMITR